MRWKKTVVAWVIGIIVIPLGLIYVIFGDFNINHILREPQYIYDQKEIVQVLDKNGLTQKGNEIYAQVDDAYFFVELPRRYAIKEIQLELSKVNVSDNAQIYFSAEKEMEAGDYWEIPLKNGNNIIKSETGRLIKWLRVDLTSKEGDFFHIDSIRILVDGNLRIQYYVFCVLFIIFYILGIYVLLNKAYILDIINRNDRCRKALEDVEQILSLAVNDFKSRFSGSYLGVFWGILQPLSTILLFWFVFQVGLRSNPVDDVPFILWLSAGMIPWNFFYDAWLGGTSAFSSYSYIVKKVVFKIEMLPLVKVLSSSILNLIFNIILIIIYCLYGRFMGLHIFDMIYFSFCLFMLTLALSCITATLNVFIKDVGQFMGIILQVLMWLTPLMWSYEMIPEMPYSLIYKLNPLFYVINGYRESLIEGKWFFSQWKLMIWFWSVTIILLYIGRKLMNKMKDQFADVL